MLVGGVGVALVGLPGEVGFEALKELVLQLAVLGGVEGFALVNNAVFSFRGGLLGFFEAELIKSTAVFAAVLQRRFELQAGATCLGGAYIANDLLEERHSRDCFNFNNSTKNVKIIVH